MAKSLHLPLVTAPGHTLWSIYVIEKHFQHQDDKLPHFRE